jgi:hypothetical protein
VARPLDRFRLLIDMAPKTEAELALQRKYEELRKKKVQLEQHGQRMRILANPHTTFSAAFAASTPVPASPTMLQTRHELSRYLLYMLPASNG